MSRSLLILDLDETLIHATEQPLEHPPNFSVSPYHVYKRPFLDHFLHVCNEHFELAIWTSSSASYAHAVIPQLWPEDLSLAFLWSRKRCTYRLDPEYRRAVWIKDLKKVKKRGYALERVIVVDDSPEKLARQYGNLVHVKPFVGEVGDDELKWLGLYLPELAQVENVRRVEKRGWRKRMHRQDGL